MSIEHDLKTSKKLNLAKRAVLNTMFTGNFVLNQINGTLKPFDITNQQFNVLRILRGQKKNPIMLSSIQERMINKSSNTTRLIDKLIKKKYVTRTINSSNRRKINVSITKLGLELLEKIDSVVLEAEKELMKNLKKSELETLNILLDKIRINSI